MANDDGDRGNSDALHALREASRKAADGHYTVFRFTTNWKVVLGTHSADEIRESVPEFKTFLEAVAWAVKAGPIPYEHAEWDETEGRWNEVDPIEEAYNEGFDDGFNEADLGSATDWSLCIQSVIESIRDGYLDLSGDRTSQAAALTKWVEEAVKVPEKTH